MTDYFTLLNFPRRPWLEAEVVQARFVELSTKAHPDRVHGSGDEAKREANAQFSELNSAAASLREPRDRLNHLLQLEIDSPATGPTQSIAPAFIDLMTRIGQACRDVDRFLDGRARATSPMVQAQLFAQGLDWTDRIANLQSEAANVRASAETELKEIDAQWPANKPLPRLRELAHVFAMVARWEAQLKERFAKLAGG